MALQFQSTLSSRRATNLCLVLPERVVFQSTLSSRRATGWFAARSTSLMVFQSTLSSRRATIAARRRERKHDNFNPRSPHGERPEAAIKDALNITFQSTLSSRRATLDLIAVQQIKEISIHALLTESDGL